MSEREGTMKPVVLQHCIGWLHVPDRPRATGVVLCPALGREGRWSYRSMRHLAERLAASGLPTLRFDYPGTGNAPDGLDGAEPLAAWRQSLHDAVDWLRTQTGLEQVALCGLRFGGLLAADVAASRTDIAALALLSPILSGRTCARELRLAAFGGEGDDGPVDGIEVDGMLLPSQTLTALAALDLKSCDKLPAPRVLILDDGTRAAALAAKFEELGGQVALKPFAGYPSMMRAAASNQVPSNDLATVADWFGALSAEPCSRPLPTRTTLHAVGVCERALQFGPGLSLVGTLCEPEHSTGSSQAVLITNTGGDGRAGIARFGVRLAHKLASMGIASLRFDFAGLGDSALPMGADFHLYQTPRTGDIRAAMSALQAAGYQKLGGVGLCTGAYHLLHAAFDGLQFDHLALINPVTFRWQPGDIVEVPQRALGLPRIEAPQFRWDGAAAAITSVLDRGTNLLVMLGLGDPGISALEASFGRGGETLAARPGATVRFERGMDHTLSRQTMQDRVGEAVAEFLEAEPVLANV
jgi:alpha/beta superfamily hydrolase